MLPNTPPEVADSSQAAWYLPMLRNPLTSISLAVLLLLCDFLTGPAIQVAITFVFPVALAAWYCSRKLGYFLAFAQSLVRMAFVVSWKTPYGMDSAIGNAIIRIVILCLIAWFVGRAAAQSRELNRRAKVLSGTLPICLHCKKIQDEKQEWEEVELYISRHTEAHFQTSLCPTCAQQNYSDILGKA